MRLPEGWKRITAYAVRKAPWTIGKVAVQGSTIYVLSDDAGVRHGKFESAAEAIEEAERIDEVQV